MARPLSALLAVRTRVEKEARAALGDALGVEADAARLCQALDRLACAHARRRAEARSWLGAAPARGAALEVASRFVERIRGEALAIERAVRASADALRMARERVDRRRELLGAARLGVRAIERHRERCQEARRREAERRAESDVDDGVSARARARRPALARTRP